MDGSTDRPSGWRRCNRYTTIIIDEALGRGIEVEVVDPERGELTLRRGARRISTIESMSELTSAVAFRRCDDKAVTRRLLASAGHRIAPGRLATFDERDRQFLDDHDELVVKPTRGEGGRGITVGVRDPDGLDRALGAARAEHTGVLLEARQPGDDLRVLVIGGEVAAASIRRAPTVIGDGSSTVGELTAVLSAQREAATDGSSTVPIDAATEEVVSSQGVTLDHVLEQGRRLAVRRTANLHTGGTMQDVTDELHPALADVAVRVCTLVGLPVGGVDLIVASPRQAHHTIIEVNEQPGLANHEPRPTAERFIDLLFPETSTRGRSSRG